MTCEETKRHALAAARKLDKKLDAETVMVLTWSDSNGLLFTAMNKTVNGSRLATALDTLISADLEMAKRTKASAEN